MSRTDITGKSGLRDQGEPPLRVTVRVTGVSVTMVVTGRRVEARLSETPQKIEIIGAQDYRALGRRRHRRAQEDAGVDVVRSMLDADYDEKRGWPLPGAALTVNYQFEVGR